ncbi:MAG: hypothetical protein U0457_12745 [Candidatus Sericytochromatia bacterium]
MGNKNITDLILLIGTNPLPNLVVAKFFIKENYNLKNIWLVYSEGTEKYKNNLTTCIKEYLKSINKELSFEDIEISNERASKEIKIDIQEKIIDKIKEDKKNNRIIHLNYTGGTKSMVVHSYRTLENEFLKKISFSYLNAENFKIYDDLEEDYISNDLRKEIKITFDDLTKLHNYTESGSENIGKINLDTSLEIIEKIFSDKENFESFFKSENGYKREMFSDNNGELLEKAKDIDKSKFENFQPNAIFKELLDSLPNEYSIFDKNFNLKEIISNKQTDFTSGFLDGKLLEYYVFNSIKEILDISDKQNELLISSKICKDPKKTDMEIDITYIKGYQLFAISCSTTDDKYMAKSKAFEVLKRAKQLGGDEAKSILITCLDYEKNEKLQNSLNTNDEKSFICLSFEDLKKDILQEKILEFIEG